MHIKKSSLMLLLTALAIAGPRVRSQATVTENQTTYVYVSKSGSDSALRYEFLPVQDHSGGCK